MICPNCKCDPCRCDQKEKYRVEPGVEPFRSIFEVANQQRINDMAEDMDPMEAGTW